MPPIVIPRAPARQAPKGIIRQDDSFVGGNIDLGAILGFFKNKKRRNTLLDTLSGNDPTKRSQLDALTTDQLQRSFIAERTAAQAKTVSTTQNQAVAKFLTRNKPEIIERDLTAQGQIIPQGDRPESIFDLTPKGEAKQDLFTALQTKQITPAKAFETFSPEFLSAQAQAVGINKRAEEAEEVPIRLNAISQGKFEGRPFSALNPTEKQEAILAEQQLRIDEAEARTLAEIKVAKQRPVTEPGSLITIDGQRFPVGTTLEQAAKAGAFKATPSQLTELNAMEQASAIVANIDAVSKKLITADFPGNITQGIRLTAESILRSDTDAAVMVRQTKQFAGIMAQTLGGEGARLAKDDIDRVVGGFVNFFDTKAVRDRKMNFINLLVESAKQYRRATIFGQRGQAAEILKRIKALSNAHDSVNLETKVNNMSSIQRATRRQELLRRRDE